MQLSQLESARVALWGFGQEGRAAYQTLRRRWPSKPLTVFCPPAEHAELRGFSDPNLHWFAEPDVEQLDKFDVVIKSPGISAYHPSVQAAREHGVVFTSGTALWFAQHLPGLKLCVTGTKGKSSTTALIAHLLRSRGLAVGLAGNIGLPLLELIDPPLTPAAWAIELSSYQTMDALQPDVAVVLNLYPEHLDWHGSEQRYIDDKLALITRADPARCALNHLDPRLRALGEQRNDVLWFGREDGWHVRDGAVYFADRRLLESAGIPLPGEHNLLNLCAALTAIDALNLAAEPLLSAVQSFQPLPHRLQSLGERDGIRYVNDSISTTPHASIAALRCQGDAAVAILVGGFERGLPWDAFVDYVAARPPAAIVCRGQNGERIHALLRQKLPTHSVLRCDDWGQALNWARESLPAGGVILLSPGAPSFPEFRNYAARGDAFAAAAGFDASITRAIPGLGIQ